MNVQIIRVGGREEHADLKFSSIAAAIQAECLDAVDLRDGRMMLVDDLGHSRRKPVNHRATRLYHKVCRPGTTHQIVGDVAIILDTDCA